VIAYQGGQKNHNGQMIAVLFFTMLSTSDGIEWIIIYGHLNYFQKPPLGGRPNTKLGHHGTPNTHKCWFILFYHVWGPLWIKTHRNSIWVRTRSHMTSHYTWGSVTTLLHDFEGVLSQPLDIFFGLSQFHALGSRLVCEVALREVHRNKMSMRWTSLDAYNDKCL
jgi:hypothetical protein